MNDQLLWMDNMGGRPYNRVGDLGIVVLVERSTHPPRLEFFTYVPHGGCDAITGHWYRFTNPRFVRVEQTVDRSHRMLVRFLKGAELEQALTELGYPDLIDGESACQQTSQTRAP